MDKNSALSELKKEIEADKKLPLYGAANLVFGEGNSNTDVLFIGEAPGYHEDQQMRPFVGQAGKLLDKLLLAIAWPRGNIYITNIVKRRPPANRDPLPEEIEAYKPYLKRQIEIINPKVIATLGRFSLNYFLPLAKISRDHGKLFKSGEWFIVPMLHPAAALRGNEMMKMFVDSFKKIPNALKKIS